MKRAQKFPLFILSFVDQARKIVQRDQQYTKYLANGRLGEGMVNTHQFEEYAICCRNHTIQ